jgi:bacteriocin biosynthesis cyclodehydratase domain-containing protein
VDADDVATLMHDQVPHLAVRAAEAIGVVGPLVHPGLTTCLRCVDASKAARDPAWPKILAQAGAPAPVVACDTVLTAATAALATAQALAVIDGRQPTTTVNGSLELVLPDWQWRRRPWPPHPACTCGAVR